MRRRMRSLAAIALLLAMTVAWGSEGEAVVWTNQFAAVAGTPPGKLVPTRVSFRDAQFSLAFDGADKRPYRLVRVVAGAPIALLDDRGGGLPLPAGRLDLFMDPAAPCAAMGVLGDCKRLGVGVQAGRNAVHWKFRKGNRKGPGGTDHGEMWLDAETGFLLAYEGRTLGGQVVQWQVDQIRYVAQDESLYELPEVPRAKGRAGLKR